MSHYLFIYFGIFTGLLSHWSEREYKTSHESKYTPLRKQWSIQKKKKKNQWSTLAHITLHFQIVIRSCTHSMLLKKYTVTILPLSESNTVFEAVRSTLCGNTHWYTWWGSCVLPFLEERGSIHGRHVVMADKGNLIR